MTYDCSTMMIYSHICLEKKFTVFYKFDERTFNRNTEVTFYNLGSACGYLLFVPHCTHFMPHILALWSRKSLKALEFNDIMSL